MFKGQLKVLGDGAQYRIVYAPKLQTVLNLKFCGECILWLLWKELSSYIVSKYRLENENVAASRKANNN